jgi:hypothetical protein
MAMKDITDAQVCRAVAAAKACDYAAPNYPEGKFPYDFLMEWTGQPMKVCYRTMERACDRGFIAYGVSLRTGWLTEKGRDLVTSSPA